MTDRGKGKAPLHRTRSGIPSGLVSKRISEIDVTEGMRSLALSTSGSDDEDETPRATPRIGSPASVITPPGVSTFTMFPERPRQSSEATIKPVTHRPNMMRKAKTAPTGQLHMYHPGIKPQFKPQPPRRAISAMTAQAFSRSGSRHRRRPPKVAEGPSKVLPLTPTELSQLGTTASRSLISRRKTSRNSGGKRELMSKPLVWRMSSPPKQFEVPPEGLQSFSEKARVKETLKSKKIEALKIGFPDVQSRGLPTTPSSVVATPREMYGVRAEEAVKTPPRSSTPSKTPPRSTTPLRTPRSSTPSKTPPRSTTPLNIGTPPTSATVSRSGTLTKRAKHFSLPLSLDVQRLKWRRSMVVDTPPRPAPIEKRTVYIPGPIQLEEKISATPRRGSVANMERFDDGTVPRAKRFSDIVALDGIVMYFQALGVAEEASEACLDRYWTRNKRPSRPNSGQQSPRKAAPRIPAVPWPPVPPTPPSAGISTTFDAIFRSQKALRDEKAQKALRDEKEPPASPGTPGRRKPLLRQLLKSSRKSG